MKELIALQSVLSTLGVQSIHDNVTYEGIDKAFYAIRIGANEVSLQGVFATNLSGWIMTKFPNAATIITDTGYVHIRFEAEGVAIKVCLT